MCCLDMMLNNFVHTSKHSHFPTSKSKVEVITAQECSVAAITWLGVVEYLHHK